MNTSSAISNSLHADISRACVGCIIGIFPAMFIYWWFGNDLVLLLVPFIAALISAKLLIWKEIRGGWITALILVVLAVGMTYIGIVMAIETGFFMEKGFFSQGPFTGTSYTGDLQTLREVSSMGYRQGKLTLYIQEDKKPAILSYKSPNVSWAVELTSQQNWFLKSGEFSSIQYGLFRDTIHISPNKRGLNCRLYLWRSGKIHRYYIID